MGNLTHKTKELKPKIKDMYNEREQKLDICKLYIYNKQDIIYYGLM